MPREVRIVQGLGERSPCRNIPNEKDQLRITRYGTVWEAEMEKNVKCGLAGALVLASVLSVETHPIFAVLAMLAAVVTVYVRW